MVTLLDPFGNVDTSFTGSVTIALSGYSYGTTLGGTLTATAVKGVATTMPIGPHNHAQKAIDTSMATSERVMTAILTCEAV